MNIFNISKIAIATLLLLILSSCNEDKGNYDYSDINEVTISGIKEKQFFPKEKDPYTVEMGDIFKLTPNLKFSMGDDPDLFSYGWYITNSVTNNIQTLLSTDRNLSITIEGDLGREGDYGMAYIVTNKNTGVKYRHNFDLRVLSNKFSIGYTMLTEKSGNSYDIDIIGLYKDSLKLYTNILALTGSELPKEGKPLDIVTFEDVNAPSPYETDGKRKKYSVYLLTDKRTDRIKPEDFSYQTNYNISKAYIGPSNFFPNGVVAEKMSSIARNRVYMYANNNWYYYSTNVMLYLFEFPINTYKFGSNEYHKTAPYIFSTPASGAILFDIDNNRFVVQRVPMMGNDINYSKNVLRTEVLNDNEGDAYKFNNSDYELHFMANRTTTAGFAVVKNKATGKYELLEFNITGIYSEVKKLSHGVFPDNATNAIKDAKFFAWHPTATIPYLYFATEDKVYRTLTTSMITTDMTSDVVTSGHKISAMKYVINSTKPRNNILGIATYDPNGTVGENGTIKFFDTVSGSGNLEIANHPAKKAEESEYQIIMQWNGIGKVIGFDYKQQ